MPSDAFGGILCFSGLWTKVLAGSKQTSALAEINWAMISSNFIQNWSILVTAESPEQQVPFFIACSTQCSNFGGDWNAQETVSIRRLIKMGMTCNNTPRPRQGNGRVLRPGQAALPKKSIPSSARCIDCTNWHHLLWIQDWNGMNMNSNKTLIQLKRWVQRSAKDISWYFFETSKAWTATCTKVHRVVHKYLATYCYESNNTENIGFDKKIKKTKKTKPEQTKKTN